MGFKIGRSTPAPQLETKKTARYGEQKVVATETPVATEQEEVVALDAPQQESANITNKVDDPLKQPIVSMESDDKPAKVKRGRKPKKQ